jgi:shikimate kinase
MVGHIVMIGLMGSGKSTVGRVLAERLGVKFSDSDDYLQDVYGLSAREIAARDGADVLHEREAEHVLAGLSGPPQVIAAAASTVEDPRVRDALRPVFTVWVDAPDDVLARRMRSGDHRPDFAPAAMRARREPYFREVATLRLDVTTATPEESVKSVCEAL